MTAIGEITQVINRIADFQNTIASAVEEQTATTTSLGMNVDEAARGSGDIAQNIQSVAEVARGTTEGANELSSTATDLSSMSSSLQGIVSQFRF